MKNEFPERGFGPYGAVFPKASKGYEELLLPEKVGKAKAGRYLYIEHYCLEKGCDCRQVVLQVVNEKQKMVALIDFPLDINNPFVYPDLHKSVKQSAMAVDLLEIFLECLAETPDWYKGMCERYRRVRKKIDQHPYRGGRFPSKKSVQRFARFEGEEDIAVESFYNELQDLFVVDGEEKKSKQAKSDVRQGSLFDDQPAPGSPILTLIDIYRSGSRKDYGDTIANERNLRSFLQQEQAADELISYLVETYLGEKNENLDAALRVLADVMAILRTDLERNRPAAVRQMESWQLALANHVFAPGVDHALGAEVTRVLLDARVDILPQLHAANTERMQDAGGEMMTDGDFRLEIVSVLKDLEQQGVTSSFELVDVILQMMAVGDPEVQLVVCQEMFYSELPMAREASALFLFHPHAEVREKVVAFLTTAEGGLFTPVMLRRLIVARNWLPKPLRAQIDQAINSARQARVECAALGKPVKVRTYASTVDGADAQTLQIISPRGKGFRVYSIMAKKGEGVADAFYFEIDDKLQQQEFLSLLKLEAGAMEVDIDYINSRICQVLADGSDNGRIPSQWLVAASEELGQGQWQAIPFDINETLAALQVEAEGAETERQRKKKEQNALRLSNRWPREQPFAVSWFEDDSAVDEVLDRYFQQHSYRELKAARLLIIKDILEARRRQWLERLVVTTNWLKAVKKPPLPWLQIYYVAAAVADNTRSLTEIPLMGTIAEHTVEAYLGRLESGSNE